MKAIKKILILVIAAVMLAATAAFAGCEKGEGKPLSGSMQIVIAPDTEAQPTVIEADLSKFTDKDKVFDVIDALTNEGKLCYKGYKGVYGWYFTAIGVQTGEGENAHDNYILEEGGGKYLYAYTNVTKDMDDSEYTQSIEYGGETLKSALVGLSGMSIKDGAIIYITYIVWG